LDQHGFRAERFRHAGVLHWSDVSGYSPLTTFLTEAHLMVRPCSAALIYWSSLEILKLCW
jgi:hypothetical protein